MKKYLILLGFVCLSIMTNAQTMKGKASYGYCKYQINVSTENDSVYLSLYMKAARLRIVDNPKMLLRLMNDSIISLDGTLLSSTVKSDGAYVVGSYAVASNYYITEAKFPISHEQMESLSKGVRKIRLNTSPVFYEKSWRRDELGRVLYEKYKESSSNSFEDDF